MPRNVQAIAIYRLMLMILYFEKQSCLFFHHVIRVRHCQASS